MQNDTNDDKIYFLYHKIFCQHICSNIFCHPLFGMSQANSTCCYKNHYKQHYINLLTFINNTTVNKFSTHYANLRSVNSATTDIRLRYTFGCHIIYIISTCSSFYAWLFTLTANTCRQRKSALSTITPILQSYQIWSTNYFYYFFFFFSEILRPSE